MITIDDRKGSGELHGAFPHGMSELGRLQFGDMCWLGSGPGNEPWMIGVERKTIGDLVGCITSGRFSGHQLIGLLNTYNVVYVVVEGLFRPNPSTGVLETWKRGRWSPLLHGKLPFLYSMVVGFLNTIASLCGVVIVRTATENETVHTIMALYHWWADKRWDEHTSHKAFYTAPRKRTTRVQPMLVAKIANQLDGVGWERADAISGMFGTVGELVAATESDLQQIPGIGSVLAVSIVRQLRGGGR